MRYLLLTLTLLALPFSAASQITSVAVSGASYHFSDARDWNEINPGVHVEVGSWQVGVFENSLSGAEGNEVHLVRTGRVSREYQRKRRGVRVSVYVARVFRYRVTKHLSVSAVAGITTGYGETLRAFGVDAAPVAPIPMAFPRVRVQNYGVFVDVYGLLIPPGIGVSIGVTE